MVLRWLQKWKAAANRCNLDWGGGTQTKVGRSSFPVDERPPARQQSKSIDEQHFLANAGRCSKNNLSYGRTATDSDAIQARTNAEWQIR